MSQPSTTVGIIANPASGKDIRRLIAHATTIDNQGKVGIVRRALIGLGAAGVQHVLVMPDPHDLGRRALEGLRQSVDHIPTMTLLDMAITGDARDSETAARLLREAGVGCIIVLGGDGTVRAASKTVGEVPLLPISTGTNNVLPGFVEGTIAGLAAGMVARRAVDLSAVAIRHKWLELRVNDASRDRALVDLVALEGRFIGSRAIWTAEDIRQVIVTRADPTSIGMSAIVGAVRPTPAEEPVGVALALAAEGTRRTLAAIGPGLMAEVGIASVRILHIDETVEVVASRPLIIALDGEREIVLYERDAATVALRADGPWIVDAHRVMHAAAAARLFDR